jgi:hypothetical protein
MSKTETKTELLKVQSIDDVARISKMFFDSKMFKDLHSIAQAGVKVMAGSELGISPFQAISGVHIISGKPVIGAGLMASMVDRHPEYDFEVLEQTDKVCSIKFYKNGKVRGTSIFTEQDAKKAGTQNMGKFPANMLYARAMSNGVKWYAPGVFAGPVYVPEEMNAEPVTEDTTYTEVEAEIKPSDEAEAKMIAIQPEPENAQPEAPQAAETTEENHTARYASNQQKEDIISLLNHSLITRQEKTKMLLNINRFDEERAAQAIEKLAKVIKDRENGTEEPPAAPVKVSKEQVTYRNMEETA